MTEGYILGFVQNALLIAVYLAGPVLLTSLIVGSLVSLFQAATQINEVTLTFIPKIISIGIVLAVTGSWMGQQVVAFTTNVFTGLATIPH
jgi:flagellar biosynthesis protein FliQ